MLLHIRNLLPEEELRDVRRHLDRAEYEDGTATAGRLAQRVKRNLQVKDASEPANESGRIVLEALARSAPFRAAVRPKAMLPPLFSRYETGMQYGEHLDNPMMGGPTPIRTDVSVTVFLNDPAEYTGGDLVIRTDAGTNAVRGNAGDAFVYPSNLFHAVTEVTGGARHVAVTWVQSLVRDESRRRILYDLDLAIDALRDETPDHPSLPLVRKSHSNLLRMWCDV